MSNLKVKNGQVSPFHAKRARKAKSKNKNLARIEDLNIILEEIAQLKGWSSKAIACKKIGIPNRGAKVTSKQMPGYIGMAKQYLRECKRLIVCANNTRVEGL